MTFDKLKPGTVVWDVQRRKMGNTTISTVCVYAVRVYDSDPEKQTVMASWNSNPIEKFHKGTWSKWRLKEPKTVRCALGNRRLAKRGE